MIMVEAPYPDLDELLNMLGEAGQRLDEFEACEAAAGNLSVCLRWPVEPRSRFQLEGEMALPQPVPGFGGMTLLVSGSGCRLRDILDEPEENIACIVVNKDGLTGKIYTSSSRRFTSVTSEFNSHLGVHYDQMQSNGASFNAIVHAQPVHLTYLSHIPRYQDEHYLNTHLLRWQPETIVNLPEGIGCIPFRVPGSLELVAANLESLRRVRLAVWAKHGVMARSNVSVMRAVDLVEYAETAARYEVLNLAAGEAGQGLSAEEIRAICASLAVKQDIF
jgi:rhamnulose-1-phosphate aldolase